MYPVLFIEICSLKKTNAYGTPGRLIIMCPTETLDWAFLWRTVAVINKIFEIISVHETLVRWKNNTYIVLNTCKNLRKKLLDISQCRSSFHFFYYHGWKWHIFKILVFVLRICKILVNYDFFIFFKKIYSFEVSSFFNFLIVYLSIFLRRFQWKMTNKS